MNVTQVKRAYVTPQLKVMDVRPDERIAAAGCQVALDKGTPDITVEDLKTDFMLAFGVVS